MATKKNSRQRSIKSKLMAAISMLLVSTIMLVSSTYAWFTLSTAPEVTGITTAVGANGNLEMALLPKTGDLTTITSAAGDSVLPIEGKNVTWGNLVDLSDSSVYGLDSITLYPAALNADAGVLGSAFLSTPTYGADGRVATLTPNTVNGYYNATEKNFFPNNDFGVRAIGTATGMTERQLAYRNAQSTANTAAAQAKTVASNSLNNNGSALANIAIKRGATNADSFTQADVASLQAIVDDLLGTEGKTGVLQYIERAYLHYILAYAASAAGAEGDTTWKAVQAAVEADGATAASVMAQAGVSSEVSSAISEFEATKTAVKEADTLLKNLAATGGDVAWTDLSPALHKLADTDAMMINGIKASEIRQGDNMSDLVNSVASGGLKVTMATGGGVYADVADHCGDYTASVVIEEVSYNGLTLKNMTARMETATTVKPVYLTTFGTAVTNAGAPASEGASADKPITDMFGYVIDLAFRTNAAESNLLLQKEAVDRIYGDNENMATMGGGTYMTFTKTNALSDTQMRDLMKAIRIVFFTPGDNKIVTHAMLDVADDTPISADGVCTANLTLIDIAEDNTVTAKDSDVLMALTQNQAVALSVLVYLDGALVGNEDVAASAATSMTGKLNLQFASSATLVPMDYAQLHTPATAGGTTGGDTAGGEDAGNTETTEPTDPDATT